MVRGVFLRPTITAAALPSRFPDAYADRGHLGRPSKHWLLLPALLVATAVGAGSALGPVKALLALPLVAIVACVWRWPALAAYLIIGLTPLTVGISRGGALPLVRPNEALSLLVGVALVTRGIVH